MVAIEAIEAFFGAEPKEAILILGTAEDGAVGEAILYLIVPEIIGLSNCPAVADDEQQ
jgi:hypothetical protein